MSEQLSSAAWRTFEAPANLQLFAGAACTEFGRSYRNDNDGTASAARRLQVLQWPPPPESSLEDIVQAADALANCLKHLAYGFAASQTIGVRMIETSVILSDIFNRMVAEDIEITEARFANFCRVAAKINLQAARWLLVHPLPDPSSRYDIDRQSTEENRIRLRSGCAQVVPSCFKLMTKLNLLSDPWARLEMGAWCAQALSIVYAPGPLPTHIATDIVTVLDNLLETAVLGAVSIDRLAYARTIRLSLMENTDQLDCHLTNLLEDTADDDDQQFELLVFALVNALGRSADPSTWVDLLMDHLDRCEDYAGRASLWARTIGPLLTAIGRISLDDPSQGLRYCYRASGLLQPTGQNHPPLVFLVPGDPTVAVIDLNPDAEVIPLPDVEVARLTHCLLDHAWDGDRRVEVPELRKKMKHIFMPLLSWIITQKRAVKMVPLGVTSLVPFQSLTFSSTPLSSRLHLLLPQNPTRFKRFQDGGATIVVDDEMEPHSSAVVRLLPESFETLRFDSGIEIRDSSKLDLSLWIAKLAATRYFVYFGHGHVEQHRAEATGLVAGHDAENNPLILPAALIQRQDFSNMNVALLMTCFGGQPSIALPWMASIASAFGRAGARSVISPIWPVEATIAREFLSRLLPLAESLPIDVAFSTVMVKDPSRFAPFAFFSI